MRADEVIVALDQRFRACHGRIVAALTRRFGVQRFAFIENAVQDAYVRALERWPSEGTPAEPERWLLPEANALPARLAAMLDVLYIVFSEGFNPTDDDAAHDSGLCNEALRLVRLLTETKPTAAPAAFALRALLCFHASRVPARVAGDGSLLLMAEQDRARWDSALLAEAFACLNDAGSGTELTRFHIEAAIAACHALGTTYATTDWARIAELYDLLRQCSPSVVVDVNRALAKAMDSGARVGLDELDAIPEREVLGRYPYALAAYADLHASLGNLDEARAYLDRALANQSSPAQHALLKRKRAALGEIHAVAVFARHHPGGPRQIRGTLEGC